MLPYKQRFTSDPKKHIPVKVPESLRFRPYTNGPGFDHISSQRKNILLQKDDHYGSSHQKGRKK
jgi:hypothetical protein